MENDSFIAYRVKQIQTLKFSFEEVNPEILPKIFVEESTGLNISIDTSIRINREESLVSISMATKLTHPSFKKKTLIYHFGRTSFEVQNLTAFFDEEKDDYSFPNEFMIQILGLSYTHCRALIAIEIGPTIYKDYFMLPVIDPSELIKGK